MGVKDKLGVPLPLGVGQPAKLATKMTETQQKEDAFLISLLPENGRLIAHPKTRIALIQAKL